MKNIDHLPDEEKQHYLLCDCGEYMDMRNLSDVFKHLHGPVTPAAEWTYAVRKGEPAAHVRKGGRLHLN